MENAYFVIDDALSHSSREGFVVMLGDPDTAIGVQRGEFLTLKEAERFLKVRERVDTYYRVFLARRHGAHKVKFVRIGGMLVFDNGIDHRARMASAPEVAKFRICGDHYEYCVIGTQYGYIHTSSGTVRTWKTASGARHMIERYQPL